MKRIIIFSNRFAKDYALMLKRRKNINKLKSVIELLENMASLPLKFKDHKLIGEYNGSRELHI